MTEWALAMMSYGTEWRTYRKLSHEALNVRLTGNFHNHHYKYTNLLLSRLLEAPELFMEEAKLYILSYLLLRQTAHAYTIYSEACPELS